MRWLWDYYQCFLNALNLQSSHPYPILRSWWFIRRPGFAVAMSQWRERPWKSRSRTSNLESRSCVRCQNSICTMKSRHQRRENSRQVSRKLIRLWNGPLRGWLSWNQTPLSTFQWSQLIENGSGQSSAWLTSSLMPPPANPSCRCI